MSNINRMLDILIKYPEIIVEDGKTKSGRDNKRRSINFKLGDNEYHISVYDWYMSHKFLGFNMTTYDGIWDINKFKGKDNYGRNRYILIDEYTTRDADQIILLLKKLRMVYDLSLDKHNIQKEKNRKIEFEEFTKLLDELEEKDV